MLFASRGAFLTNFAALFTMTVFAVLACLCTFCANLRANFGNFLGKVRIGVMPFDG
jgi:hypothetical protein